jgi:hypothetical protein
MNKQNNQSGSLLSSQEPHQKEDIDQATGSSAASYTLEPEKGLTPDPDQYNKGDEQGNIKQRDIESDSDAGAPALAFDEVNDINLNEDEFSVTNEDLKTLNGEDDDV